MSEPSYEKQWILHLDTSFDEKFTALLPNGLRWLPWVGKEFRNSSGRILVVGESHYTNEGDICKIADKKAECHSNVFYTREIVSEYPLEGYEAGWKNSGDRGNNPTFDNLHRTLLKDDLLLPEHKNKRSRLWSHLAFYNFIQNAMDYGGNRRERPSPDDFLRGWKLFIQLADVLHPKACIFIGVQASNSFNAAMGELSVQHKPVSIGESINGVYLRNGGEIALNDEVIKLVFIKHTSQYFSWETWSRYLESLMPETIEYLRTAVISEHT